MLIDLLRLLLALVACIVLTLVFTLSVTPDSLFEGTPLGIAFTLFTLILTVAAIVQGLAGIVSDLLDACEMRTGWVLRFVRTAREKGHTVPGQPRPKPLRSVG
jgi:hypothetical protein